LTRTVQLSFASSFRDTQSARNFRMAKSVNADQHEYMPRTLGQRGNGAFDIERRRAAA
jgi:hypothetical protein